MNQRVAQLEALLRRVLEWTPALPAESGLLDEITAALEDEASEVPEPFGLPKVRTYPPMPPVNPPRETRTAGAPTHEPCEQSAKQDLAYYDGARAAAAMAHQSLSVMDKWINGGCGGRWQEAKAAMAEGAPRGAGSEPSEYMCPCGLNSVACRESACSEDKQRHLVGVPTPSRTGE